jgi:hypothetical protein
MLHDELKRMQQLANINELEIQDPNILYTKFKEAMYWLSACFELEGDRDLAEEIEEKFNIKLNDTQHIKMDELEFPIKSKEHLIRQIFNITKK